MAFLKGDVREPITAMLLRCLPPSHVFLTRSEWRQPQTIVLSWEREKDLSATLANHLIGCHTALTFEGYGSISPEMKKRDEREGDRGRGIGYAVSVLWIRRPLSMHLSIHPRHTASSPLWSAPTLVLRLLAPSLTLSSSFSISPREKRGEGQRWKEEEEIQSGASQGALSECMRQGRARGTAKG